jgi:hypothetical protein
VLLCKLSIRNSDVFLARLHFTRIRSTRRCSEAELSPETHIPGCIDARNPWIEIGIPASDVENIGVQGANIIVVTHVLSFCANFEPGSFEMSPGRGNVLLRGNVPHG